MYLEESYYSRDELDQLLGRTDKLLFLKICSDYSPLIRLYKECLELKLHELEIMDLLVAAAHLLFQNACILVHDTSSGEKLRMTFTLPPGEWDRNELQKLLSGQLGKYYWNAWDNMLVSFKKNDVTIQIERDSTAEHLQSLIELHQHLFDSEGVEAG